MAHAQPIYHPPLWLQLWHVFALIATGVGLVTLLTVIVALALYGG